MWVVQGFGRLVTFFFEERKIKCVRKEGEIIIIVEGLIGFLPKETDRNGVK